MNLRRVLAIQRKEVVQIRRDPRSLAIVFLMPVMLMVLMGAGISLDQKNVPVCIFDREGSQQSQDLLKHFQASPYFRIVMVNTDYRTLTSAIDSGRCSLGVVIPSDFSEQLRKGGTVEVQGIVDAVDDNTANLIFGYAESVLAGYSASVQIQYFQSQGLTEIQAPISIDSRTWFNEDLDSSNFIVPGVVVLGMVVVGTLLTALAMAPERQRVTSEQMISTRVTPMDV